MLALVLIAALKMRVLRVRSCREREGTCFSHGEWNVSQTGTDCQRGDEIDEVTINSC